MRASSIVRLPFVAPPYNCTPSTPALNALAISAGPTLSKPDNVDDILRNINSRRTPEVPPIESEIASAIFENKTTGWSVESLPLLIRFSTSVAPRFIVIPQSPSPTIVSYFVRRASFAARVCVAFKIMALDVSAKSANFRAGRFALDNFEFPSSTTTSGRSVADGLDADDGSFQTSHAIQAGASVGASKYPIKSFDIPDKFKIVTDAPCMSNDVMKLPTSRRETLHPSNCDSKYVTQEFARMDISKFDVPPKLLTRTQSSSPFSNKGTIDDDPSLGSVIVRPKSRIVSIISFAISSAVNNGDCFKPASPWIPSPISIVSSSNLSLTVSAPGTVTLSSDTPSVPIWDDTCWTIETTSSNDLPCVVSAAAAPAILCTSTVPATPRAPVIPFVRGTAQSSATMTI
mmetsp:Transcript_42947/g.103832  ORF Transcript_42947/g.103832 Transcript_42947/m.103832 type:complete len:402 (-) Transcript_42947:707-1912(-)